MQSLNEVVLANALQLGADVIMEMAGNDISNHLNGAQITRDDVTDLLSAKINAYLLNPATVGGNTR